LAKNSSFGFLQRWLSCRQKPNVLFVWLVSMKQQRSANMARSRPLAERFLVVRMFPFVFIFPNTR